MANLLSLRYMLKIPSEEILKHKKCLTLDRVDAINKEFLVTIASNYLIRQIDYLKKREVNEETIAQLKLMIKRLKRKSSTAANKRKLFQLQEELFNWLYVPDLVNVVISKNSDYDKINEGFEINGIKFRRLLATSAGVKTSTIVYINENLYDVINENIDNGRNLDKTFVAAKLESYRGLVCSASTPVTNFSNVLVVPDLETNFTDHVLILDDTQSEYPVVREEKDYAMTQNASDGFGLISPRASKQWASDLKLDYLPAGYTTRHAYTKGMLFTFDFHQFAKEVAKTDYVRDIWGNEKNIHEIDIILTASMLKLWDSYSSFEEFFEHSTKNNYTFAVTKCTPRVLDNERSLNYQFIQSLDLTDEDIEELIKPTCDEIKEVLGNDYRKTILFLRGMELAEETVDLDSYEYINALMVEPRLIDDPYIQSSIHSLLKKKIDQAKIGVLKTRGNYQVASGDAYALCQHIFGLEVTGLLQKGEFFSNFWNQQGVKETACFRAPMICYNNVRRFSLVQTPETEKWFKYMDTVMILNSWDATCSALCGCDFDGDTIFSTNNPVILKAVHHTPAIVSIQKTATKIHCTEADFIQANKLSFGNEIGSITNKSTSMYDVLAQYPPGSLEYEELMYRIICTVAYSQNAIDKSKGIEAKPMPIEWYQYKVNVIDPELDDEETIARKELNMKLLADKRPYFFNYIYPERFKIEKQYRSNANRKAIYQFNLSIDQLLEKEQMHELTSEQAEFLYYYRLQLPSTNHNCVMNKICWRVEEEFKHWMSNHNKTKTFDYQLLKTDCPYNQTTYKQVQNLYDLYVKIIERTKTTNKKLKHRNLEQSQQEILKIKQNFKTEALKLCSNEEELANMLVDFCYSQNRSKRFVWDLVGEQLVDNLLQKNEGWFTYLVRDEAGDIAFRGHQFSEKRKQAKKKGY